MSLKPDDELLNYNFETYRINLNKLLKEEKVIEHELFNYNKKCDGINLYKVKLFGVHNNLFLDHFNTNSVYFVTKNIEIFKITYCEELETIKAPHIVLGADKNLSASIDQFPASIFFLSPDLVCLDDGLGFLHIVQTPDRISFGREDTNSEWKVLSSISVIEENINSTLMDCRIEDCNAKNNSFCPLSEKLIHCCFLRILDKNENVHSKNVDLLWVVYKFTEKLTIVSKKIWKGNSPPEMVTFSNDFKTLDIVANHSFRFISPDLSMGKLCKENVNLVPYWCNEDTNSVTLEFYLNIHTDFEIDINNPCANENSLVINIKLKEQEPVELYRNSSDYLFDKELSNWHMQDELLIITLKRNELIEAETVSNIPKLTDIGMEDIDDMDDSELTICSFDGSQGHVVGDEIHISKNAWLFKTRLGSSLPMAVCLRSNVDGLVWTKLSSTDSWTHCHTLNALGFVAASKIDRKFVVCSLPIKAKNGLKFAVISDWKRDLYVLMQYRRLDYNMTLKNRNTGKIFDNVADEFLVTLDKSKEIMGIVANDSFIFVLFSLSDNCTGISIIHCC